ncbi:hypothetical protein BD414DRAFT_497287 [Trametes punicea]|nr:hypothetical protein BD414DRAFT_497287 [Trametes punicea]
MWTRPGYRTPARLIIRSLWANTTSRVETCELLWPSCESLAHVVLLADLTAVSDKRAPRRLLTLYDQCLRVITSDERCNPCTTVRVLPLSTEPSIP